MYICGLAYDYCVGCTAEDAALKGLEAFVVTDCTKGIAEQSIEAMKRRLVDARVQFIESVDVCIS